MIYDKLNYIFKTYGPGFLVVGRTSCGMLVFLDHAFGSGVPKVALSGGISRAFCRYEMDFCWSPGNQNTVIITELHHSIMVFVLITTFFIFWMLYSTVVLFGDLKDLPLKKTQSPVLETVWTLIPCFILLLILFPSIALIYQLDSYSIPEVTLKMIGHQWYWSVEYSDRNLACPFKYDSIMVATKDLLPGRFRLLEVDKKIILPINTNIRLLVSAADVLHSFSVPSLGLKLDACPGRLNETFFTINHIGKFYGQCSEICGYGHALMPCVIQSITLKDFDSWCNMQSLKTLPKSVRGLLSTLPNTYELPPLAPRIYDRYMSYQPKIDQVVPFMNGQTPPYEYWTYLENIKLRHCHPSESDYFTNYNDRYWSSRFLIMYRNLEPKKIVKL
jgi:heme/copper-type cytochrome/quinol oxidase subunit 2